MTPTPSATRAPKPELTRKMQGKQPVSVRQLQGRRPEPPPKEGSKMAMDFYIASMLESQVRQLMTEPDGKIHLDRCPTPYRKFLLPSPAGMAREDVPFFEAEIDEDEEASVAWFEAALTALEKAALYFYNLWPAWPSWRKKEAKVMPPLANDLERGHTPMFVEMQPDTPGSQATPIPGARGDDASYFSVA